MSDTATQTTENTQTQEAKIPTSIGKVQRVEMTFPNQINTDTENTNGENKDVTEGANATKTANNGGAAVDDKTKATPSAPTFNEADFLAMLESQGVKVESLDKLKEQLKPKDTNTAPTEAEIKEKAIAREKRLAEKWISGGGTIEQLASIRGIAESDANKFAIDSAKTDLMKTGLTEEEATQFLKDQYFQIDDAELEQEEDETDKAFKKRTKEYFAKQLANLSSPIRSQAAGILADLNSAIESEDLQVAQEVAISAKIDEDFKALPRKLNIEIGDIGGGTIASPLEFDYSETVLAEVQKELKDPAKRQQLLFNNDGSLNYTEISKLIVKARSFDSVAKISYLESQTRTNAQWQKVFPSNNPSELGVGGNGKNPNGQNGSKIAGIGKVQRVQPQRQ